MWNRKDCNKNVGSFIKAESQRIHLSNVRNIQSSINFKANGPWKPTFSLSRHRNRYYHYNMSEIERGNSHLVTKIHGIDSDSKHGQIYSNVVPESIPSNKNNFEKFKKRQRRYKEQQIKQENQKMFYRIMSAKNYDSKKINRDWSNKERYKQNCMKKDKFLDFSRLAKSRENQRKQEFSLINSRKKSRENEEKEKENANFMSLGNSPLQSTERGFAAIRESQLILQPSKKINRIGSKGKKPSAHHQAIKGVKMCNNRPMTGLPRRRGIQHCSENS